MGMITRANRPKIGTITRESLKKGHRKMSMITRANRPKIGTITREISKKVGTIARAFPLKSPKIGMITRENRYDHSRKSPKTGMITRGNRYDHSRNPKDNKKMGMITRASFLQIFDL